MKENYERLLAGYINNQLGMAPDFISNELAIQLQKNLQLLAQKDKLHKAGVGMGQRLLAKPEIRKDRIFWLDQKENGPFEKAFFSQIEDFIKYLNETCYTGITDYEFHYALYEPGSFYKKHKDQFRDSKQRQFSMITYLNDDWQDGDGGELMVYKKEGVEKITPNIGKTVFFKSNELPHEVLLSNTHRMSITGWLKKD